jgi:hypothetical protein
VSLTELQQLQKVGNRRQQAAQAEQICAVAGGGGISGSNLVGARIDRSKLVGSNRRL